MSILDIDNTVKDTSVEDIEYLNEWINKSGGYWVDKKDYIEIYNRPVKNIMGYKEKLNFFQNIPDRIYKPIESMTDFIVWYCLPQSKRITLNNDLNVKNLVNFRILLPHFETYSAVDFRFTHADFENEFDFSKLHAEYCNSLSLEIPYNLKNNQELLIKNCKNLYKLLPTVNELNSLYIDVVADFFAIRTDKFLNDIVYNLQNIKCKTLCIYIHTHIDHFENGGDRRSYRDCFLKNDIDMISIKSDNRIFQMPNPFF